MGKLQGREQSKEVVGGGGGSGGAQDSCLALVVIYEFDLRY